MCTKTDQAKETRAGLQLGLTGARSTDGAPIHDQDRNARTTQPSGVKEAIYSNNTSERNIKKTELHNWFAPTSSPSQMTNDLQESTLWNPAAPPRLGPWLSLARSWLNEALPRDVTETLPVRME